MSRYWAIVWGGQLISLALGAPVTGNPVREIGWLPVRTVDNAAAHDWLAGLPPEFEVFHWHGETFAIPAAATCILESRDCPNQAFVIDGTLAMQCHVEMTEAMVRLWVQDAGDELNDPAPTIQSPEAMTAKLATRVHHLQAIAEKLYTRWIQGLK